jgi:hypothetical protein
MKAAEILQKAGMGVGVEEFIKVSAETLRGMAAGKTMSVQQADALVALTKCLTKDVSFRVKFDKL